MWTADIVTIRTVNELNRHPAMVRRRQHDGEEAAVGALQAEVGDRLIIEEMVMLHQQRPRVSTRNLMHAGAYEAPLGGQRCLECLS